jgi:hypothetical protein
MPEFEADREPLHCFELEGEVLFKHYFDHTDLFEALQPYYDDDNYRFAVPADKFEEVAQTLSDYWYEPVIVDDPAEFVVVKEQYTEHADILRDSVANWTRRGHNFFLMKDPLAVEAAVEQGATRVAETDLKAGV